MDEATQPDAPEQAQSPRVKLDSQVEFSKREVGSRSVVILQHHATGKFFQLGPEEARIAELLDGSRGVPEIVDQLASEGVSWAPDDVAQLIARFVQSGVAQTIVEAPPAAATGQATEQAAEQATKQAIGQGGSASNGKQPPGQSVLMRVTKSLSLVVSQRIPLIHGDALARWCDRRFGVVFSTSGMVGWALLVASGLAVVFSHRTEFAEELRRMFDSGMWLVLIVIWALAKVLHELGHATAARYHGVRVGKIGIMFFFLAPLAYVDVTDAWKLRSRWDRIQIALGGVYVELAVAAAAAWVWFGLPDGIGRHLAAQVFVVTGPATLLVNANPLLRLDGYYVVSDLTEIPNLRAQGRQWVVGVIERLLVRIPPPRSFLVGWRKWFAAAHAIASVLFQVVWMTGLVIGVWMWTQSVGIVLAIAATTLWLVIPMTRWLWKVWNYPGKERFLTPQRVRLVMIFLGIASIAPSISWNHSPLDRRVPVVVQFCDEQVARAATDAFVSQVYVERGGRVVAGTLMLELTNPELVIRRDQKADDLALAEHRMVQLQRQGSLSQAAAEEENAASLRRQLDELDQEIASLRVVASRSGFVMGRGIQQLRGRFVSRGQELLRVSDPQEKQLLASVGPRDTLAYEQAVAQNAVSHVRLRGGISFEARPNELRPSATRRLPHPALAAAVGGPLPVEPSDEESVPWRSVDPQMESVTLLDPITSREIQAGQIGTMTINDNQSLVSRIVQSLTKR